MSNTSSRFLAAIRASGLSAKTQELIIDALKKDLADDTTAPRSAPPIMQNIQAASNDGRSTAQKVLSRAVSQFAVQVHAGKVDITDLDNAPRFKRMTAAQRIETKAKLRHFDLLRGYAEMNDEA